MIDEDWRGFAPACAEAARPDDARGRSARRMLLFGLTTVLIAGMITLVVGALDGPHRPARAAPGTTWTAVAGPSCTGAAAQFSMHGYFTEKRGANTGWTMSSKGGYRGADCTGTFVSVPVSGTRNAYDRTRYVLWSFDFSQRFSRASCQAFTFVPDNRAVAYVGGEPAYYYLYANGDLADAGGTPVGGYPVDQVAHRGQWVASSPFSVTTGQTVVKMVDAGAIATAGAQNVHVAAAQVRLTCRAT